MTIDKNVLFSLAKEIYALHCAINQLSHIESRAAYRETLVKKMDDATRKFGEYGGVIETGTDVFGEKGPVLSYPAVPKEPIPYDVGRLDCERFLNF